MPELAALYDAFETPRAVRGDLRILGPTARASTSPRSASARPRRCSSSTARATADHPRDGAAPRAAAHRDDAPGDGARRPAARRTTARCLRSATPDFAWTNPRRAVRDGRRSRAGFAYDNERPRHARRRAGLRDRPAPGHQRHLDALRRGRRLRAPRVVVRRGLGVEGGVRHHPRRSDRRGGRAPEMRPPATSPGSRPKPWPAGRAHVSRPRRNGRRDRPGAGPPPWTAWDWCGSGPRARSAAIPASSPTRTASTPRSSSATTTASCAAGPGPPTPRVATTTFRNWDLPAAPADLLPACGWPATRRAVGWNRSCARRRRRGRSVPRSGDERTLADDVLDGLTRPFKELPPKHFYDAHGAELFDQICDLPEYYPTRCERAILETRAAEIAAPTGAAELVELGSGTAAKTRVLLQRSCTRPARCDRYVPLDVTESMVRARAAAGGGVRRAASARDRRRLRASPQPRPGGLPARASSPSSAARSATSRPARGGASCAAWRSLLGPDDVLLLGTDLVKDPDVLEAAYDDSAGVTAEFNRNVLRVLNRELDADFEPDAFDHVAFFDREREWIEMRLRAPPPHGARSAGSVSTVTFAAREELRTEISAKFTPRAPARRPRGSRAGAARALHRRARPLRAVAVLACIGCRA